MIKKYGFNLLVGVTALGAAAFKVAQNFSPLADNGYIYDGSASEPQKHASYYLLERFTWSRSLTFFVALHSFLLFVLRYSSKMDYGLRTKKSVSFIIGR